MTCPMYEDFTRMCVEVFKDVIHISNYDICQAEEGYKKCVFYRLMHQSEKERCKYTEECHRVGTSAANEITIEKAMSLADMYCLSDNKVNCAVYKQIDAGKEVPEGLIADGSKVELKV